MRLNHGVRNTVALLAGAAAVVAGVALANPANGAGESSAAAATPRSSTQKAYRPPIGHVWIIMLEDENEQYTYGAPGEKYAPYLAKTLRSEGAFLPDYYGTGHDSLDNYVASVSGQASNYELGQDCKLYSSFDQFDGENYDTWTKYGQLSGEGCVFPKYVKTIVQQLQSKHLTWRGYMQDMGKDPIRDGTTPTGNGPACGHPPINTTDLTDIESPKNDSYALHHNPFMYFQSITGNPSLCDSHVLSFKTLSHDLKSISTTANYNWISPSTCNDGHDWPKCADGKPGRLPPVNTFLKTWIPKIMASPAYKKDGMILITTDESGQDDNATACCGTKGGLGFDDPAHPNMNEPGVYGPGGGRVGAVVLSPFIRPGTVSHHAYNHFSQLRSVEDIFGLGHLGDAQMPGVNSFGSDVYTLKQS